MFVELVPSIGDGSPVRIEAAQVVIYNDRGTPVAVVGEYGPAGAVRAAHAMDKDFQQVLRAFGCDQQVTVHVVDGPRPPDGSRSLIRP